MEWILLAHALGGAMWFGGQVYTEGLVASAARTRDPETIMTVGLQAAKTSQRVLGGAALITLVFGTWIVFESVYTFEMVFVIVGFAVAVIGIALSRFIVKPKTDEIGAIVAERGPTDPEALAKLKGLGNIGHAMTLLLTIAMILMVLKVGA